MRALLHWEVDLNRNQSSLWELKIFAEGIFKIIANRAYLVIPGRNR